MAEAGSFAERVKQQADIVRVIGEYVRLKKSGQNFTGLCPFHQEKTPSFAVHPVKQIYHCFGCGVGGDVFKFVMEVEKSTFPEAIRTVAEKCGIAIPKPRERSPEERHENQQRSALVEMHREAAAFFVRQLHESPEGKVAFAYLEDRGLDLETMKRFGLGYAPSSGDSLLRHLKVKFPEKLLEASGLLARDQSGRLYDKFRRRIMFPIANESGKVIAFGGRAIGDDMPKYMNSPETPIYSKSHVLYHLDRAKQAIRQNEIAVLVEGYMDAIAVARAGITNVVAACGTSLAEQQAKLLSRCFSGDIISRVVVNYDPDIAGQSATDRSIRVLLAKGFDIKVLVLPSGYDPDKFIRTYGVPAYIERFKEAKSYAEYLGGKVRETDLSTPNKKLAALNFVLPFLQLMPNAMLRSQWATDFSQSAQIHEPVLREAFRRAAAERSSEVKPKAELLAPAVKPAERQLIRMLVEAEGFRERLAREVIAGGLHRGLQSERLIDILISKVHERSDPAALAASLEENDRRLLFEILFESFGEMTWEAAENCLSGLHTSNIQDELAELRKKIESRPTDYEELRRLVRRQQELLVHRQGLGTPRLFLNFVNRVGTQDALTHSGLSLGNDGGRAFNIQFEVQDRSGFTLDLELPTKTVGEGETYQVKVKCCEKKDGRLCPIGGTPSEQVETLFDRLLSSGEEERFSITIRCDDNYKRPITCRFVLRRDDLNDKIWCELIQAAAPCTN